MNSFRRSAVAAVAAASLVVLAAGCGSNDSDAGPKATSVPASKALKLKIGVQGTLYFPSQAAEAYATDAKVYGGQKLSVEWVAVQQVADCARSVAGGSLDACMVESFGAVNAMNAIKNMKLVAQLTPKNVHYVIADSSISGWSGLAGKKIGAGDAVSGPTLALKNLMEKNGANPADSTFLSLAGTSAIAAAFKEKQIDAGLVVEPFQSLFPDAKVLGNTGDATPLFLALVARPGQSAETDAALARFLQGSMKGVDHLIDPANKKEVVASWVKWVPVDPSVMSKLYDDYAQRGNWTDAKKDEFAVDKKQWADTVKLVGSDHDPDSYVDDSIRKLAFGS